MPDVKRDPLAHRVMHAGAWAASGLVIVQGLRLVSNLIMTRLLAPEMFGILAIANVLLVGLALFSDLGLHQNAIQSRRGTEQVYLDTLWTLQILRGLLIWVVAVLIALGLSWLQGKSWVAEGVVYAEPVLPTVIVMLSLTAVINGFVSTKTVSANRELSLAQVTRLEIISQLAAMLFMILWALLDSSIWALVAGALFGAAVKVFLSHRMLPGANNQLRWESAAVQEIFHFGKWIFLSSILGFLAANGDRLLLGGLVDAQLLGYYAIAFLLFQAVETIVQRLIAKVALPAFSEVVRERRSELRSVYYRFRAPVDMCVLAGAGILFVIGDSVVQLLYDDRYMQSGEMLEVLGIGLIMVRYSLDVQCALAMGIPKMIAATTLARAVGIYFLLPVGYAVMGIQGALWAIVLSRFVPLPLYIRFASREGLFNIGKETLALCWFPLGAGLGSIIEWVLTG